jgi:hypothetical protein
MRATTLIKTPSAIPTRTRATTTTRAAGKASMRGARAVTNAVPIHIGAFDDANDANGWKGGSWIIHHRVDGLSVRMTRDAMRFETTATTTTTTATTTTEDTPMN